MADTITLYGTDTNSTASATSVWPITTQPTGYTCTCGAWVQYGIYHQCYHYPVIGNYWSWPTVPTITAFRGSVKTLDKLPKTAPTGNAYYVEDVAALVVRQANGWFHFDKS